MAVLLSVFLLSVGRPSLASTASCSAVPPSLRVSCGDHGLIDSEALCTSRGCCWSGDGQRRLDVVGVGDDDLAFQPDGRHGQDKVRPRIMFMQHTDHTHVWCRVTIMEWGHDELMMPVKEVNSH